MERQKSTWSRPHRWLILIVLLLLQPSGCSTTEATKSDSDWCIDVRSELTREGVGWPVAQRPLSDIQLDAIHTIFARAVDTATGDLHTAARAWMEGYDSALPYLRTGDENKFNRNVDDDLRTQFHLANIALTRMCRWFPGPEDDHT